MPGTLKTWFFRNVLESAEREFGAKAIETVSSRVSPRLRPHLSLDRLRSSAALDTLPLDEAEELLLMLDTALGDGTGRALERVAEDLYAKTLIQGGGAVRLKDLFGTVARLRGLLEHPFEGVTIQFDLSKTETGLSLALSVVGHPRATKVLRHLAAGAVRAAERFARESVEDSLKLFGECFADRARLIAQYRSVSEPVREIRFDAEEIPTPTKRQSQVLRGAPTSLSAEVDRILNPSLAAAELRRGSQPPPRSTSSPTLQSIQFPRNTAPRITTEPSDAPRSARPGLSSRAPAPAPANSSGSGELIRASGEYGPDDEAKGKDGSGEA